MPFLFSSMNTSRDFELVAFASDAADGAGAGAEEDLPVEDVEIVFLLGSLVVGELL